MKIALVHDYLKEFGGAERVLRTLADMYPGAPIYTAFVTPGSDGMKEFADRKILQSSLAPLLRYKNLHSPLRFLIPLVWRSIDLSSYDLVITSCSGYIARGFKVGEKTKVVAYCHTPPRFLYGYETSIDLQRFWIVRVYSVIVNHFLRLFDYWSSQRVNFWITNSENVKRRIEKFYRKGAEVVYPPIEVEKIKGRSAGVKKEDFYLIVSRLVGAKGLEEAMLACKKVGVKLKIAGGGAGYNFVKNKLGRLGGGGVELLGRVSDEELGVLYARAKGFVALARQEDFGMTVVEAQAAGTPVIAFRGGGFLETVIEGKTGIFVDDTDVESIAKAIKLFEKTKWDKETIQKNANRFDSSIFVNKIRTLINA